MINIPKKMPALRLIKYRHPFVKDTIPVPHINDNEVLVSIKASSLNPIDYTIQSGKVKIIMPYKLPSRLATTFRAPLFVWVKRLLNLNWAIRYMDVPMIFKVVR